MHVRIVDVPAGEAPDAVRKAWLGLVLPSIGRKVPRVISLFSYRKSDRDPKYLVPVESAISILEQKSPEAAAWWRANTPHVLSRDRYFAFAVEDCEELIE